LGFGLISLLACSKLVAQGHDEPPGALVQGAAFNDTGFLSAALTNTHPRNL
jgi:hypothetical protein